MSPMLLDNPLSNSDPVLSVVLRGVFNNKGSISNYLPCGDRYYNDLTADMFKVTEDGYVAAPAPAHHPLIPIAMTPSPHSTDSSRYKHTLSGVLPNKIDHQDINSIIISTLIVLRWIYM